MFPVLEVLQGFVLFGVLVLSKAVICIKHFLLLRRTLLLVKPYFEHEIVAKEKRCHDGKEQHKCTHLTI